MAMCKICSTVRRKPKGDSWDKQLCHNCYILTEHFTWKHRWDIHSYTNNLFIKPKQSHIG